MDGDKPVCFWKGDASEFEDPDPEFRWLPMINDLAVGKVDRSYKAGLI